MVVMNVLSLFDGISCCQQALIHAGCVYNNYFASEININAITVAQKNFPNTIQLGDVNNWRSWDLPKIDLITGGSPCQGFSHAGKGLNFEDPRSKLFFEFLDILQYYNPKYFLLENVRMKEEWRNVITDLLMVSPVLINSNLFVAQNRQRLYWTNIPLVKNDLGGIVLPPRNTVVLKDILEPVVDEHYFLTKDQLSKLNLNYQWTDSLIKSYKAGKHQQDTIYHYNGIMGCLSAATHGAARHLTKTYLPDGRIRRLTEIECERLQGLPDDYTAGISSSSRYEALGNGWTIDVISYIFKHMS